MTSSRFSVGSSVLSRARWASLGESFSSPIQFQMDGLVSRFVDEATNPTTLAALCAGGMAYRLGRIGVMGLGIGHVAAMPLRLLSLGFGLGSEVTAFELANRSLQSFQSSITDHRSPNLWSWSGPGGLGQGLLTSALTFGILKSAGFLARDQNLVFQHAFQSLAMVGGQNMARGFGLAPRSQETLAEQFLEAETMNLQLGSGVGMLHSVAPGLSAVERSLDLSLGSRFPRGGIRPFVLNSMRPQEAVAGGENTPERPRVRNDGLLDLGRIMAMSSSQDPEDPPPPPSQAPMSVGETRGIMAGRLLDEDPVMILLTGPSQEIVYANREARRVLGQGIIGQKITDLLHFDETKGKPHYRLRTETGLDLLWEDRPHLFLRQRTAHFLLDVTGKEETEKLLEELRIKASEGHFGREVIHDARSALTPSVMLITRLVDLLKTRFPEEELSVGESPSLNSPLQIAQLMKSSIEQTMGIFDTGTNILRGGVAEMALDQILLDAIHLNQPLREKNNIRMTIKISAHLDVVGNKRGLLEVLNNLLTNACEAMPEEGKITLKAYPDQGEAVIEVEDTGPGIPDEIRDRIFDAGFSTKGEAGSGIGLSTVKKIIEQLHRGSIEVERGEMGRGSVFRIRLPLSSSSHPPPEPHP